MNCDKSLDFMSKWQDETTKLKLKRKLTEFSLQLTPTKFQDMINYKKILMENLEPKDIELTITSFEKEVYNMITDSKMKSLCLSKAKEMITDLELSAKNPDEEKALVANAKLDEFLAALVVKTTAYSSNLAINADFGACKTIVNDCEIAGIQNTNGLSFDILTFDEGYTHTFVFRLEFASGDKLALYSAISRDGAKGEKPKVYASAFINKYYISKEVDYTIYI